MYLAYGPREVMDQDGRAGTADGRWLEKQLNIHLSNHKQEVGSPHKQEVESPHKQEVEGPHWKRCMKPQHTPPQVTYFLQLATPPELTQTVSLTGDQAFNAHSDDHTFLPPFYRAESPIRLPVPAILPCVLLNTNLEYAQLHINHRSHICRLSLL